MMGDARSHGLWERTAPPAPETRPLDTVIDVDVAVVGAGYTGLSAARAYDLNQLNLPSAYLQSFNTARSNLIKCGNAAGTSSCGQPVGILQSILGSVLTSSTGTTPLLNGSAAWRKPSTLAITPRW